jgi:hypothetical protein
MLTKRESIHSSTLTPWIWACQWPCLLGGGDGAYGYGDDDTDSDACSYSNSSLAIVVRGEETRVLESPIDCRGVLEWSCHDDTVMGRPYHRPKSAGLPAGWH